jgi:hypothetical protein
MQIVATNEARVKEVMRKEGQNRVYDFFGAAGTVHEGPQGFIAELPDAGARIDPHFHDVDQFQVIIAGDGNIAREKVEPGAFHFADAFMPYGPILAKDKGISFYTLRLAAASGVFAMPANRRLIQGKPSRNISGLFELGKAKTMGPTSVQEMLIEPHEDGLKVAGLRIGPGASAMGVPSDGGGQYCIVCTGSLRQQGKDVPTRSLILVEAGEPSPLFEAGPDGAEILVLQFPRPTGRPGSDPGKLAGRGANSYQGQVQILN